MRRVETGRCLVQRIDHYHGGTDGTGTLEHPQCRIGEQDRTKTMTVLVLRDRQASDQSATDERVSRDMLPGCLGNSRPVGVAPSKTLPASSLMTSFSRMPYETPPVC